MFYKGMSAYLCTRVRFSRQYTNSPTVGNNLYVKLEPHKSAETHTTAVVQFPLFVLCNYHFVSIHDTIKVMSSVYEWKVFFFFLTHVMPTLQHSVEGRACAWTDYSA